MTNDDFRPPDPQKHRLSPGRFNGAGQLGYYLAEAPELAAIEVLGDRNVTQRVWIAKVKIEEPLHVVDLTFQIMGSLDPLPLVLNSLVYSGALSDYGDDLSLPQYRVPQFLADLLRHRNVDGVLYSRRRDSGFPNPEAWGTNLLMLRHGVCRLEIEPPAQYRWTQMPFDFPTGLGGVLLEKVDG